MAATSKRKQINVEFEVGHETIRRTSGTRHRISVQGRNGNDDITRYINTVLFKTNIKGSIPYLSTTYPYQIVTKGNNITIQLRFFETMHAKQKHTIEYKVKDCLSETTVNSFAFIEPSEEEERLLMQGGGVVTWLRGCGGYEATVCGLVDRELMECNVCLLLLRNPAQLFCGHVFCRSCIDKHIEEKEKSGNAVECPSCRENIDEDKIFEDKNLARRVLSLRVQCTFCDTCTWTGELRDFDKHVNSCPMSQLTCIFCKEVFLRQSTEEHRNTCIQWPFDCPHSCGKMSIARKDIEGHTAVCPDAPKDCPFKDLGCSFRGNEEDLEEHLSTEVNRHLTLTVQNVQDCKQRIQHLEEECNDLKRQLVESKSNKEDKELAETS